MPIFISIAASLSTFLGGLFALRFTDKRHLILGFSAGAVMGVAFFDLLPEALLSAQKDFTVATITSVVALGFTLYLVLDRAMSMLRKATNVPFLKQGTLGAGSLSVHSFLDGVAIGLAFQVSGAVGLVVSVAVLVHDFSDGINTVNFVLRHDGGRKEALSWLFLDSVAPILGVLSTLYYTLDEGHLGLILALFAGFFLYIGASDLLPQSRQNEEMLWTTIMTLLGMFVLYIVINLV